MKDVIKFLAAIIGVLVFLIFLGWMLSLVGIVHIKLFGAAQENARREVFENTQSFVDGKRTELLRYKLQYETEKDSVAKKAIRYTILHSMVNLDESKLDPSLQSFLSEMRR